LPMTENESRNLTTSHCTSAVFKPRSALQALRLQK
jgi:hypothetical protein